MDAFAIRRNDTGQWLTVTYSKGPLMWSDYPKLFGSFEEAKRTLAGFKAQTRRMRYRGSDLLKYESNIEIVHVRLEVL